MGAVDTPVPPVGLDGVRAARELLAGVVSVTPIAGSRALFDLCGGPVWLKCENLQRTGHRPIALVGGGTTKVGDPSGKDETRQLLDETTLATSIALRTS